MKTPLAIQPAEQRGEVQLGDLGQFEKPEHARLLREPAEEVAVIFENVSLRRRERTGGTRLSFRLARDFEREERTRQLLPFLRAQMREFAFYFGQRHARS